jgi:hypothetical protein
MLTEILQVQYLHSCLNEVQWIETQRPWSPSRLSIALVMRYPASVCLAYDARRFGHPVCLTECKDKTSVFDLMSLVMLVVVSDKFARSK